MKSKNKVKMKYSIGVILLAIICWIIAIYFFVHIIITWKYMDPWGMSFTFDILPSIIIGILFIAISINLTKKLISKKE